MYEKNEWEIRKTLEREHEINSLKERKENLQLEYNILREGKKVNTLRFILGISTFILAVILFIFSAIFVYNPPETKLNVEGLSIGFIIAGIVTSIVAVIALFNSQKD